jgi:hypothetical protein
MGDIYANSSIKIEVTNDLDKVKSIIFHPEIINMHSIFNNIDLEIIEKELLDDKKYYHIMYVDNSIAGISIYLRFTDYKDSPDVYVADVGILKKYRGKTGLELEKLSLYILYNSLNVLKVMCAINKNNDGAICFAKKLGFKIIDSQQEYLLLEVKNEWNT